MTAMAEVLARFAGSGNSHSSLWLPDLTQWYAWQRAAGTLPEDWLELSLPQVARALGVPVWTVARPWHLECEGGAQRREVNEDERVLTYETPAGVLEARWSRLAGGGWWQTEYPVKSAADLPAARALVEARRYVLDLTAAERLRAEVGEDGVVALELPSRPYADLLQTLLGWSDGLLLLMGEERPAILELLAIAENQIQGCVAQVAGLPGEVVLSPDNLDGQFISPAAFREHLAPSYRRTADDLHAAGKRLLVHAGGAVRRLLPLLAEVGVDGVQGIAGPPQSDASLAEARAAAGPNLTLWGGIPQDFLLPQTDSTAFADAVADAAAQCRGDARAILGVADKVPEQADLARLRAIPDLVAGVR